MSQKANPFCQHVLDHGPGGIVHQGGARCIADVKLHAFDHAAHLDGDRRRERALFQHREASVKGSAVAQGLRGRGIGPTPGIIGKAEKPVGCRDDGLDFGIRLGFQKKDGVDQPGWG